MILYDVGNTNIHRYKKGAIKRISHQEFEFHELPQENFFYISVNEEMEKAFILSKHAVNLSDQLELDTQYTGLGIDRVAACLGAEDGIIIDAGSAITIDIMSNGIHLGGYLLPGFSAMRKAFASVSPLLDIEINPKVDLHIFPQNTKDSMSQGVIKPLVLFLESIQSDKRLYFTGGDGKFLSTFFDNAIYDKSLVFKGMLRCIHDKNL